MKNQSLKQQIIKNSFWNLSFTSISRIGGMILTIIIARYLLPEKFGLYSLALSFALIFTTFAELGISQTMIRYVSSEINQDKNKASSYFRYTAKLKLLFTIFACSLFLILSYPLSNYLYKNPYLFHIFLICIIYVFSISLLGFFESVFFVLKKVNYLSVKETIYQFLRIIFAVLVFILISSNYYIEGIIISSIIINFIVLIVILFLINKSAPFLFLKSGAVIDKKRVRNFLIFISITFISSVFLSYMDIVLLGIFVSPVYIGFYRAVLTLVLGIAGLLSLYNVFLPFFTEINGQRFENVLNQIFKYLAILTIPATAGLIVLGKYFIIFIYGYPYIDSIYILYFLAPLIFIEICLSLFFISLSAKEYTRSISQVMLVTSFFNILLNLLFIKILVSYSDLLAAVGAAIATLLSRIIYFFALNYLVRKKLNIKLKFNYVIKPLAASLIMSLLIIITNHYIKDMSFFIGAVEVLFGVIVYFLFLYLFKGISKKDFELIHLLR